MGIFDIIAILIAFSGIFLFVNTYFLKLPSSIGLMILALIVSLMVLIFGTAFPEYHLAEKVKSYDFTEVMYHFVLNVMLFTTALNIDFKKFGSQLIPILVLTVCGVLISALTIGSLVYLLTQALSIELPYLACLVFGALISCADPVAITKNIRKYRLSKALEAKVEGESLLTGALSIILAFSLVKIYQLQNSMEVLETLNVSIILIRDLFGGLIMGILFGWVGYKLLDFIDNDVVEAEVLTTLALVMTGSFLADRLEVSSMLVAVMTGLIIGNVGRDEKSGEKAVGDYVYRFWQLMQETIASMLFVLIGFEMLVIPHNPMYFGAGFFIVLIVLFGRWVSVFIPIKLMSTLKNFDNATVSVLTWGALRGGLPVAFTLSLNDFPGKEIIITFTYVVVVCSVLYQGFTLDPLMRMYHQKNFSMTKSKKMPQKLNQAA